MGIQQINQVIPAMVVGTFEFMGLLVLYVFAAIGAVSLIPFSIAAVLFVKIRRGRFVRYKVWARIFAWAFVVVGTTLASPLLTVFLMECIYVLQSNWILDRLISML